MYPARPAITGPPDPSPTLLFVPGQVVNYPLYDETREYNVMHE